jgi:SAM-dependent methyltransferase
MAPADFPAGFFERAPAQAGLQATLDDAAVAAIRDLYSDLGVDGRVLDLGGAAQEHFDVPPDELLAFAGDRNATLPYGDDAFDDVVFSGGVGALTRPRETFAEAARVLRAGGRLICTFASSVHVPDEVRGWVATDDAGRVRIVRAYFGLAEAFGPAESDLRTSLTGSGDRLWAVWAAKTRP